MGFDDDKIEKGITLNMAETKFVAIMLDHFWDGRNNQSPHEILGLNPDHPKNESEDWLDDVATELAESLEKIGQWETGSR